MLMLVLILVQDDPSKFRASTATMNSDRKMIYAEGDGPSGRHVVVRVILRSFPSPPNS